MFHQSSHSYLICSLKCKICGYKIQNCALKLLNLSVFHTKIRIKPIDPEVSSREDKKWNEKVLLKYTSNDILCFCYCPYSLLWLNPTYIVVLPQILSRVPNVINPPLKVVPNECTIICNSVLKMCRILQLRATNMVKKSKNIETLGWFTSFKQIYGVFPASSFNLRE